ncbi:MAG: helix-turn-helix domain-containing protein [Myxococcales bacterium]|nr:helix-turn-helix domain-containing protein [Myxococcales bacterium]
MTVDEVARYLRLGRRVVYRLAQEGVLPGRKIANRWRFHLEDIEAWVRTQPALEEHSKASGAE